MFAKTFEATVHITNTDESIDELVITVPCVIDFSLADFALMLDSQIEQMLIDSDLLEAESYTEIKILSIHDVSSELTVLHLDESGMSDDDEEDDGEGLDEEDLDDYAESDDSGSDEVVDTAQSDSDSNVVETPSGAKVVIGATA